MEIQRPVTGYTTFLQTTQQKSTMPSSDNIPRPPDISRLTTLRATTVKNRGPPSTKTTTKAPTKKAPKPTAKATAKKVSDVPKNPPPKVMDTQQLEKTIQPNKSKRVLKTTTLDFIMKVGTTGIATASSPRTPDPKRTKKTIEDEDMSTDSEASERNLETEDTPKLLTQKNAETPKDQTRITQEDNVMTVGFGPGEEETIEFYCDEDSTATPKRSNHGAPKNTEQRREGNETPPVNPPTQRLQPTEREVCTLMENLSTRTTETTDDTADEEPGRAERRESATGEDEEGNNQDSVEETYADAARNAPEQETQGPAPTHWHKRLYVTYFELLLPLTLNANRDINEQIRERLVEFLRIIQNYDDTCALIRFKKVEDGCYLTDMIDGPDDIGNSQSTWRGYFRNVRPPNPNQPMYTAVIIAMDTDPSELPRSTQPYFDALTRNDVATGQEPPRVRLTPFALQCEAITTIGWILGTSEATDCDHFSQVINKLLAPEGIRLGFRSAWVKDGIKWTPATRADKVKAVHVYAEKDTALLAAETLEQLLVSTAFQGTLSNLPYRLVEEYDKKKASAPRVLKMINSQGQLMEAMGSTITSDFGAIDTRPRNSIFTLRTFLFTLVPLQPAKRTCRLFLAIEPDLYGGLRIWFDRRYEREAREYLEYAPLFLERDIPGLFKKFLSPAGLKRGKKMRWVDGHPTNQTDRMMDKTLQMLNERFDLQDTIADMEEDRPYIPLDNITIGTDGSQNTANSNNTTATNQPAAAAATTRTGTINGASFAAQSTNLAQQLFAQSPAVDHPVPPSGQHATLTPSPHHEAAASGQQG